MHAEPYTLGAVQFPLQFWRRCVIANDPCSYCGTANADIVEHVVTRSEGGSNTWDNMVASCSLCNQRKGNVSLLAFLLRDGLRADIEHMETLRSVARGINHHRRIHFDRVRWV